MKKLTPVITAWIILIAMLLTMVPGVVTRIKTEQNNKNVTVSLMYSLISTRVSKAKLDEMLDKYMAAGIDTITLIEMDMNYLVAQGLASCTKFNAISLENDALSKKITKEIRKTYPNIADDSYVIQIKDDNTKKKVKYHIGKKFTKEDYHYVENVDNTDVYVIHDGRVNLWDIVLGYDEDVLKELTRRGFKIALLHKLVNYKNTAYLADVEEVVKNYPIDFINIKDGPLPQKGEKIIKDNYRKFADIINKYNLSLSVNAKAATWVDIEARMNLRQTDYDYPYSYQDPYYYMWRWGTYFPYGTYTDWQGTTAWFRHIPGYLHNASYSTSRQSYYNTQVAATFHIGEYVDLRSEFAYSTTNRRVHESGGYVAMWDFWGGGLNYNTKLPGSSADEVEFTSYRTTQITSNTYATFEKDFGEHNLKVTAGVNIETGQSQMQMSKKMIFLKQ